MESAGGECEKTRSYSCARVATFTRRYPQPPQHPGGQCGIVSRGHQSDTRSHQLNPGTKPREYNGACHRSDERAAHAGWRDCDDRKHHAATVLCQQDTDQRADWPIDSARRGRADGQFTNGNVHSEYCVASDLDSGSFLSFRHRNSRRSHSECRDLRTRSVHGDDPRHAYLPSDLYDGPRFFERTHRNLTIGGVSVDVKFYGDSPCCPRVETPNGDASFAATTANK